jgi:hypothetical protein
MWINKKFVHQVGDKKVKCLEFILHYIYPVLYLPKLIQSSSQSVDMNIGNGNHMETSLVIHNLG